MARARKRQAAVSFGLSFLDVLCCGLGAAVLLLLVVKHGPSQAEEEIGLEQRIEQTAAEIDARKSVIGAAQSRITQAREDLASLSRAQDAQDSLASRQSGFLADARAQIGQQRSLLARMQNRLNNAQAEGAASRALPADSGHLAGVAIAEDRVVILLDRSNSMLSRSLVEIILLRAADEDTQNRARKWRLARASALWAFNRIPEGASYQLLAFSDQVTDFDNQVVSGQSVDWREKGEQAAENERGRDFLAHTMPGGPTNLRAALETAARLRPKPKQVLLVTDGLPTIPGDERLSRMKGCPNFARNRNVLLTPQCRQSIFEHSERFVAALLRSVRVDVILLPLEGDASSVQLYWQLASSTGGRLLNPASGWPLS